MSKDGESQKFGFSVAPKSSPKLPFQKKTGPRQRFVGGASKRLGFGDDEDQDETDQVELVTGFENNKAQE